MNSQIPDSLPMLGQGAHSPGSGTACVMEYVSLLAGEQWSDHPACTDPVIAAMARNLNDGLYDQNRQMLVPLINRLLVANFPDTPKGEHMREVFYHRMRVHVRSLIGLDYMSPEGVAMALVNPMAWSPGQSIEHFTWALDEMDQIMRRPEAAPVPVSAMAKVITEVSKTYAFDPWAMPIEFDKVMLPAGYVKAGAEKPVSFFGKLVWNSK